MRRQLVMAIAAAALIVPSAAAFADHEDGHKDEKGNACPAESENPEGTPPNCGNGGEVPDNDGDGVPNNEDNCPAVANPGQEDENGFEDGEGAGDACEEQPPAEEEPVEEEPVTTATCAEGGLGGGPTVANQAAGTQNEEGPISSQIHANEGQAPAELQPVVHEVSCLVATVDNNLAE